MIDFVLIYQNLMKQWTENGIVLFLSPIFQSFDDADTLRGVNIIPSNWDDFRLIDRPLDGK